MKEFIAFELLENEIDFVKSQLVLFHQLFPEVPILFIIAKETSKNTILLNYPELKDIGQFYIRKDLEQQKYPFVRLFITSEQYSNGIKHIPSYCSFHGQPSKGLTLMHGHNKYFDGFLTLGPFQESYINSFFEYNKFLHKPIIYQVGYPKSDKIINTELNTYNKNQELNKLGLTDLPTILYAPAFNEYASMREYGLEIVKILLESNKWNVIVKLAVDCWNPINYLYANGGVNWFDEFENNFGDNPRFHLYKQKGIDSLLPLSDVLVTCVSSVSFEFLILGKPVVFIDTPKFFSKYLKRYFPHEETSKWENNVFVNGGREYGILVKNINLELNDCIEKSLILGYSKEKELLMRNKLLFNSGNASQVTVKLLKELYDNNKISLKQKLHSILPYIFYAYIKENSIYKYASCIFNNLKSCIIKKKKLKQTYINCEDTIRNAESSKCSINDYLEQNENSPLKIGHRERILNQMKNFGLLDIENKNVLEIGSGTARFVEKLIEQNPAYYILYETDEAWCQYAKKTYEAYNKTELRVNVANGISLNNTRNNTMDVVYAHAVFVYLPLVTSIGYLKEIKRVLKEDGLVCIDWYYDTDWNMDIFDANEHFGNRWPVIVSRSLIENCFKELGFKVIGEFKEIYSCSFSRYVILKKCKKEEN